MKPISFIIPSRNNLRYLKQAYESIRKNSSVEHEICIADDASTDGTLEQVLVWMKRDKNIKLHVNKGPERLGHTILYDTLINEYATHDVVMIFHADMYLCPHADEMIDKIIESARLTGSSMNRQPWHFIVVQNRDTLRDIGELVTSGPYNAQAAFAVVVAIEKSSPFGVSDASRAIQSMMLTAWSEGIGSNWTGWVGMTNIATLLSIPNSLDVIAVVPFGYPKKNPYKRNKE